MACVVQKFKNSLPSEGIKKIFPCVACNKLAFFAKNQLTVVDIVKDNVTRRRVIPNVASFCWWSDAGVEDGETGTLGFCVIDSNQGLSVYSYQQDEFQVQIEFEPSVLLDLLAEQDIHSSDLKIIAFHGTVLMLECDSSLVVSLQLRGREPLQVLSVLSLAHIPTQNAEICPRWRVKGDVLVAFDGQNKKLFVYSVGSGSLFAWLDLSDTVETCLLWETSDNLDHFCYADHSGHLIHISLAAYVQANPDTLKSLGNISREESATSLRTLKSVTADTFASTSLGDWLWRRQMGDLLTRNDNYYDRQWYLAGSQEALAKDKFTQNDNQGCGKKVTGFRKNQTSNVKSSERSPCVNRLAVPLDLSEGMCEMTVSFNSVSLKSQCQGCFLLGVLYLNGKTVLERFAAGEILVLSGGEGHPHLLLTDHSLATVGLSSTQEELVSRVMLYGGAGTADVLCHLNKWDRCAIPINTLETGLKHRQLDTVTFFLKSKENLFTSNRNKPAPLSPSSSGGSEGSFSWLPSYSHEDNFAQVEPAINLLVQCVRDSVSDPQSRQFAEQLLSVTLNHLYGLQADALLVVRDRWGGGSLTEQQQQELRVLEAIVEKLMVKIGELRKCLRYLLSKTTTTLAQKPLQQTDSLDGPEDVERGEEAEWEKMETQDVMESAAVCNKMLRVQQYLWQRGQRQKAGHTEFIRTSLSKILTYLSEKDMKRAKLLLASLGFSVTEKLWEFVLFSKDASQRDFIVRELMDAGSLTEDQRGLLDYHSQLISAYPNSSFTDVLEQRMKATSRAIDQTDLSGCLPEDKAVDLSACTGDLYPSAPSDPASPSPYYCQVLYHWLQYWDKQRRQRVLLHVAHAENTVTNRFDAGVLWDYYQSHGYYQVLSDWLESSLRGDPVAALPPQCRQPLPSGALENIEGCPLYIHQILSDICSRYGILSGSGEGFSSTLSQLVRVGGVMCSPHPLQTSHYLSLEQFHTAFLQYCLGENLPAVMWDYLDYYQLDSSLLSSLDEVLTDGDNWLPVFASLYTLAKQPEVHSNMLKASLSNAAFVNGTEMIGGRVEEEFIRSHPLAAIATALYSTHGVEPVITRKRLLGRPVPADLEKRLEKFPKLSHALFPASVAGLEKTDVSVYQLLQKGAPFCPSRLFGWQSTNEVASEDCMKDLPYFSHPDLVSRYAPVVRLRYTYYLRQGRPAFAFLSFLARELDEGTPVISKKRVSAAYRVAVLIAVRHVSVGPVVAGCTAFVEMLGEDSSFLRTYAHVTSTVLQHRNKGVTGSAEARKEAFKKHEQETVELMVSCLHRRRNSSRQALAQLEEAIVAAISKEKLPSVSFGASLHWHLAVLFCHQARLPYSTHFLESCAHHNQWLPFVWFSQLHQYPKEQLHGLLHLFPSHPLREHLHYVIENAQAKSLEATNKPTSLPNAPGVNRDIRFSLYTRIGLAKGKEEAKEQDSSSCEEEDHPLGATEAVEGGVSDDEVFNVRVESAPDDVFGVVFAAVASPCQWKSLLSHSIVLQNPLFAVLAASFQDASRLACLTSWLVAIMDQDSCEQFLEEYGKVATRWTLADLRDIISTFIHNSWTSALATGFDIFQMDSPLLPFLMFYAEFTERKQYQTARKMLESFKEAMFAFRQGGQKSVSSPSQSDMGGVLGNIDWFEQISYNAICYQLTMGSNQYETKVLLSILEQVNVAPIFSFPVPEYGRLHKLYDIAVSAGLELACVSLLESGSTEYQTACQHAVSQLTARGMYDQARRFAGIAGLDADQITVTQVAGDVDEMKSSSLWNSVSARQTLWRQCLDTFTLHGVSATVMADFFQKQIEGCALEKPEEAYLYQLAYDCLSGPGGAGCQERQAHLYISLWRCKLQAKQHHLQGLSPTIGFGEEMFKMSNSEPNTPQTGTPRTPLSGPHWGTELLQFGDLPEDFAVGQGQIELDSMEREAMNVLVSELLNNGQISESSRLVSVFSHYNKNLSIILACMRLAAGVVSVGELEPDIQAMLRDTVHHSPNKNRRQSLYSMVRSNSVSSLSSQPGHLSVAFEGAGLEGEETVVTMEKLLDHCQDGYSCCLRVITAFKISTVLRLVYEDVVVREDFEVLEQLLTQRHPQRFSLAKDYIKTGNLTDREVAGFLSDAIVHALQVYNSSGTPSSPAHTDLIYHPAEGSAEFSSLVRLCQNPSVLGNRLLDAVAAHGGNTSDQSTAVLWIQTELLIRAHDCHSLACNMEGISSTLRAARVLTECLARAEEFQIMIRLLTGVGRYSEISYIFDALKQNHQFELLLRKGMEKETRLKVAMLDYLKRFHSTDSDTYTMVALKFTMYREIALMLEECAHTNLASLKSQPLDNSSDTKNTLEKIVQYFSDAADSYIKDNCMRHAQVCVKQARLVALQTQLLSSGIQLINLAPETASAFIQNHTRFTEAYIVSEAYNRRNDWAAALCTNFLISGDAKYFEEFKNYVKMTPSLISEAIDRYEQTNNKPSQSLSNVRKLLGCCKDLKVKYKLAKDMGLQDMVTQMEKGDCGAYLLDIFL